MSLFQHSLKLTLATCSAAFLAGFLGADYAITAGIIAILRAPLKTSCLPSYQKKKRHLPSNFRQESLYFL
ncbi:aromatic acid exporter family protein, partial [Streptococcus danieliae]|uniref:aromatic acid exporter family protein n=1 Tax=Streptococcus danieliae TaxID=747656 RepID=UPI0026EA5747